MGCQPSTHPRGDRVDVELTVRRHQLSPIGVALARHYRSVRLNVENVSDGCLDEGTLLLYDHHLIEALSELTHCLGIQRIGHPDLQQPHRAGLELILVQAHPRQCGSQVYPRSTGCHDADTIRTTPPNHAVEPVEASILLRESKSGGDQVPLQPAERWLEQPGRGHMLTRTSREQWFIVLPSQIHGGRSISDGRDDLDPDPQPARPRHHHGVHAQLDDLAAVAWIDEGHCQIGECHVRCARDTG
jgi:hypothetical protein